MIILAIVVIFLFYLCLTYWRNYQLGNELSKNFKSVPYVPVLGNFHLYPKGIPEIFQAMMDFNKIYGKDVITRGLLNKPSLQLTDSKTVEKVLLLKRMDKSLIYEFIKPWLGTGLLISVGQKWFQRRKIITPAFHFKVLEQFIVVFNVQGRKMIEKLRPHAGKGEINAYDYVTLSALDIICETAMGVSINAQDNPDTEYVQAVKKMSVVIFKRIFSLFRDFPFLFHFTKLKREQQSLLKILHSFTDEVIQKRKKQLLEEKENGEADLDLNSGDIYTKRKLTFLDLLLNVTVDGQPLSNTDIREEVDTFMFEGHDTTTSGISFAIYHLSKNPDVQQKVYEEIKAILGDDPKKVELTYGLLQEMKYLEMTIKETLRIHPSVPVIGRKIEEDTMINDILIPAGVDIAIPIFAMHRHPDIYPNPDKFDPERFNDENTQKRGPYDYIPFSAGARNCIGQKFAILEMKTLLVKLVANYKILPSAQVKDLRYKADLVLRPVGGIFIKLLER